MKIKTKKKNIFLKKLQNIIMNEPMLQDRPYTEKMRLFAEIKQLIYPKFKPGPKIRYVLIHLCMNCLDEYQKGKRIFELTVYDTDLIGIDKIIKLGCKHIG